MCRAINESVKSEDRESEVKMLGERFEDMFANAANRMTKMESVRDAMSLLTNVFFYCAKKQLNYLHLT